MITILLLWGGSFLFFLGIVVADWLKDYLAQRKNKKPSTRGRAGRLSSR